MTPSDPEDPESIIDIRAPEHYARERARGAVWFSLEDLEERAYLLPPRNRRLAVIAESTSQAERAVAILQRAERPVRAVVDPHWRSEFELEQGAASRTALWEASPLVRRFVEEFAGQLPGRRALDIACGTGRNAVFLATHGFAVTGIDWLGDALERARDLAHRSGVEIRTVERNLEQPGALDGEQADCIVVVRYLERRLFPDLIEALTPGGVLLYETFTLEQQRLGHPRNPLYLLQPGELLQSFASLDLLFHDEGWHDGAHTAQLIARKPAPQSLFSHSS